MFTSPSARQHLEEILEIVYAFLKSYEAQHGYPPSVREIADHCYVGPSSALRYLDKLEARGWITREPGRARGITLRRPDEKDGTNVQTHVPHI